MRRTEFITGIQQVQEALTESNLQALFASLLDNEGTSTSASATAQVLTALKEYTFQAQHFNEAARQLTHFLALEELEQPEVWTKLITGVDEAYLRRQQDRVQVVLNYLPQIAELLQQKTKHSLHEAGFRQDEDNLLTLIVVEEDGHLSSPQRLAELFEGVERLYEVCAVVAGVQADKLSVLSCESGQDKAFELIGSPAVIKSLKSLILGIWDRVVFYRELELDQRIERVADSLYILEKIQAMEGDDKLGPEQAEILRRGIRKGVTKFLEAGALIPDIAEQGRHDPRELLSPEPKLLAGASRHTEAPAARNATPPEATSPQDATSGPGTQDAAPSTPEAENAFQPAGEPEEADSDRTERDEVVSVLDRITRRKEAAQRSADAPQESGGTSRTEPPESPLSGFSSSQSDAPSPNEPAPEETEADYGEQIRELGDIFDELEDADDKPLSSYSSSTTTREGEESGEEESSDDDEEKWGGGMKGWGNM